MLVDNVLEGNVAEGVIVQVEILSLLGLDGGQRGRWRNRAGCCVPAPLAGDGTGSLLAGALLTGTRGHVWLFDGYRQCVLVRVWAMGDGAVDGSVRLRLRLDETLCWWSGLDGLSDHHWTGDSALRLQLTHEHFAGIAQPGAGREPLACASTQALWLCLCGCNHNVT